MAGIDRKNDDQYLATTVLKAIDILNLIAQQQVTATEISHELKINKTTVHRLLYTLEHAGYIEQLPQTHTYRIGIKLVGICSARVNDIEIITEAKPHLLKLVHEINQPVHLGVYQAGNAVYIDKIDVINTVRIYSAIGKTIPVHCSAIGKALLLDWSDEEIIETLNRVGMPSFTNETITEPEIIVKQIHTARKCGYTVDNGEHENNVCCIASPIYDYRNKIVAAISTAAPVKASRDIEQIVPSLISTAKVISMAIGTSKDCTLC